jgi:hypothetical protein
MGGQIFEKRRDQSTWLKALCAARLGYSDRYAVDSKGGGNSSETTRSFKFGLGRFKFMHAHPSREERWKWNSFGTKVVK